MLPDDTVFQINPLKSFNLRKSSNPSLTAPGTKTMYKVKHPAKTTTEEQEQLIKGSSERNLSLVAHTHNPGPDDDKKGKYF